MASNDASRADPLAGTRDHATVIGERLRRIRRQQGRTLHDVEVATGRRFKANILSAYERGVRAISIARLAELARFYGVPVGRLLAGDGSSGGDPLDPTGALETDPFVLDLTAFADRGPDDLVPVRRFARRIQRERDDNGRQVLTLRGTDILVLADAVGTTGDRLLGRLTEEGLLADGRERT